MCKLAGGPRRDGQGKYQTEEVILKAVCHAFDWLIMTIERIGNLNGR